MPALKGVSYSFGRLQMVERMDGGFVCRDIALSWYRGIATLSETWTLRNDIIHNTLVCLIGYGVILSAKIICNYE